MASRRSASTSSLIRERRCENFAADGRRPGIAGRVRQPLSSCTSQRSCSTAAGRSCPTVPALTGQVSSTRHRDTPMITMMTPDQNALPPKVVEESPSHPRGGAPAGAAGRDRRPRTPGNRAAGAGAGRRRAHAQALANWIWLVCHGPGLYAPGSARLAAPWSSDTLGGANRARGGRSLSPPARRGGAAGPLPAAVRTPRFAARRA